MPELPEVETIKRVIEPQIQGLTIERVITTAIRLFYRFTVRRESPVRDAGKYFAAS